MFLSLIFFFFFLIYISFRYGFCYDITYLLCVRKLIENENFDEKYVFQLCLNHN